MKKNLLMMAILMMVVTASWAQINEMTFTINGVSFKMIKVEGGTFTMGATSEQDEMLVSKYDPPKTQHVTLSSYYIGQTEVTQALWQAVMGNNPSIFKASLLPVENVSWDECQEFIRRLNAQIGERFRLPTEAEWEFAARGGRKSLRYKYSGSNTPGEVAWYKDDDPYTEDRPHPVGTKRANELGLYDMSGNVWEWCQDWFGNYSSNSQVNPTGPASGATHVSRGGGWGDLAQRCRVSQRLRRSSSPEAPSWDRGLRLAR